MRKKRFISVLSKIVLLTLVMQMTLPFGNINSHATNSEETAFDPFELRVNVNGEEYTDESGQTWVADQQYSDNSWGYTNIFGLNTVEDEIIDTEDDTLYQSYNTFNHGEGYTFELPNGNYEVNLKFMDDWSWQEEHRQFDIQLNQETVKEEFDVFATCGQFTACDESFEVTITDGILNVGFDWTKGAGYPLISAIEIVESYPLDAPELTLTGEVDSVILNWNTVKDAETYTVMRGNSSGEHEILIEDIDGTELIDHAVELNEVYYYVVVAKSNGGQSKKSNEIGTFLIDVELDKNELKLEWPMMDDLITYNVNIGTIETDENSDEETELEYNNHQVAAEITTNKYDETIPSDGETYYYFIEAITNDKSVSSSIILVDREFIDTDGDGLPDYLEIELGSDINNPDTNGNGIPDGYEYNILGSDPSDLNSTVADEDFDDDGLTNLEEYQLGTDPWSADTDGDGLSDGDEVNVYKSDPLNRDTDGDGIIDGDEIKLGIDPTKNDTNGNGTLDGDEYYEVTTEIPEEFADPKYTASVKMLVQGLHAFTTSIKNVEGKDAFLNERIEGYIGAPYDFTTEATFDEAEMTFTFDETLVEGDDFEPAIFWYNEEEGLLEELEDQTIDWDNLTVTATVDHFSQYILLNKVPWDEVWGQEFPQSERGNSNNQKLEIVFTIDSSGSMSRNDPQDIRKVSVKNFIDKLLPQDKAAVVDFDSTAKVYANLTSDKEELKQAVDLVDSSGGTNLTAGLKKSIEELIDNGDSAAKKYVIFLTDGDGAYSNTVLNPAFEHDITIHTIGLGDGVKSNLLQSIADLTKGNYYFASVDTELEDLYDRIGDDTLGALSKIRLCNGAISVANLEDPGADTDGDGLSDLEELGNLGKDSQGRECYKFTSYPDETDSDRDGYSDGDDLYPLIPYKTPIVLIHGLTDNSDNIFGVETEISSANDHFIMDNINTNKTVNRENSFAENGYDYYEADSHQITDISMGDGVQRTPQRLAHEIEDRLGYTKNENLFAVNYPNMDFNWKNADIVKWYIEEHLTEIKSLYPTKQTYHNRDLKVNLIGHSNGGLVSRYYIENLDGSNHVDKLITMNTPHWGSGFSKVSTSIPTWGGLETGPLHLDLKPSSKQYDGKRTHMIFFNRDKQNYMNDYQTEEILYKNHGQTEYYFIAAYDDFAPNLGKKELKNKTFMFDVSPENNKFSEFRDSIATGFFNQYPEYQSSAKFNFSKSGGDNVVNNQSQLGVTYKDFGDGKNINAKSHSMLIDTITGHNLINSLHVEAPKRSETIRQVMYYLHD